MRSDPVGRWIAGPTVLSVEEHDAAAPRTRGGLPLAVLTLLAAILVGAGTAISTTYGFAAGLAAVLGVVAWARPRFVVYGAVLLAPILPGIKRGIPLPGLRLSEVLVVAGAFAGIVLLGRQGTARWQALDWWWLAFCGLNLGLGVWHLAARAVPIAGDDLNKLIGPIQFFLLYRAVRSGLPEAGHRVIALRLVLLASVPVSLLALAQFFGLPGVRAALIAVTDSGSAPDAQFAGIVRATGPFAHWHSLAGYLLFAVTLAAVLVMSRSTEQVLPRPVVLAIAGLDGVALLSTTTLVPITCTVLAVVVVAMRRGRVGRLLTGMVLLAAVVGVLFGNNLDDRLHGQFVARPPAYEVNQPQVSWLPGNLGFRARVWTDQYLPVVEAHALDGYGPDIPPSVTWRSTESMYLTVMMRGGLLLMVVYLGLILAMWRRSRDGEVHPEPHTRAVGLTVWAGIIAMAFAQLVHPYFTDAGLPHLLAVLVALLPVTSTERDLA